MIEDSFILSSLVIESELTSEPEIVDKEIVDEEVIGEIVENKIVQIKIFNNEIVDNEICFMKDEVFSFCGYKKFSYTTVGYIFDNDVKFFNFFITRMLTENYISKITDIGYKINLKSADDTYLKFDTIINRLKTIFENKKTIQYSLSELRQRISADKRPNVDDWMCYINDLVVDGILKVEKIKDCKKSFYSLVE